jgi:hypothetical protein
MAMTSPASSPEIPQQQLPEQPFTLDQLAPQPALSLSFGH